MMGSLTKQGSKYSDEDRRQVVIEYFITGSMTKVAKSTGIPRRTLNDWKNTDWWDELAATVRHEKNEELDASLTKLIDSSFEQAQDRVENGDFRVGKDGKLIRVPMGGRDLVMSGAIVYDKQRLHRSQPTSISSKSDSLEYYVKLFQDIAAQVDERQTKQANSIPGDCEEVE